MRRYRPVKVVLLDAIPPLMLKTPDNPDGSPIETFDEIRAGVARDRSQFCKDLSGPFYGANRPGADVSQGVRGCVPAVERAVPPAMFTPVRRRSQRHQRLSGKREAAQWSGALSGHARWPHP